MTEQTEEKTLLHDETVTSLERLIEERFRQYLESNASIDKTTERVTETFDTSKPVDSLTGTPPMQSRVTERTDSRERNGSRLLTETSANETTEADTETKADIRKVVTGSANEESHTVSDSERIETGNQIIPMILQILLCAIMSLFLTWLLMTLRKALKTLFKH